MKLKLYLRGLGIGIAVTAVIMGLYLSTPQKVTITDEEIKTRAAELGMVEEGKTLVSRGERDQEQNELSHNQDEVEEVKDQETANATAIDEIKSDSETGEAAQTEADVENLTPTDTPEPTETPLPTKMPTPTPTRTPTPTPTSTT